MVSVTHAYTTHETQVGIVTTGSALYIYPTIPKKKDMFSFDCSMRITSDKFRKKSDIGHVR